MVRRATESCYLNTHPMMNICILITFKFAALAWRAPGWTKVSTRRLIFLYACRGDLKQRVGIKSVLTLIFATAPNTPTKIIHRTARGGLRPPRTPLRLGPLGGTVYRFLGPQGPKNLYTVPPGGPGRRGGGGPGGFGGPPPGGTVYNLCRRTQELFNARPAAKSAAPTSTARVKKNIIIEKRRVDGEGRN